MIGIKAFIVSIAIVVFSAKLYGQATTHELAKRVFTAFQTRDIAKFDTLIPAPAEMVVISKEIGLDIDRIKLVKNWEEIYQHHRDEFNAKCLDFINDTALFNVDWKQASFENSMAKEETINLTLDSAKNSKRIVMHTLNIFFTDKKYRFIISFDDIYFYRGVWKIGGNVSFSRENID